MTAAVPTDEIYERYLRKAIGEINELQARAPRPRRRDACPRARLGPSARRHLPPQARSAAGRDRRRASRSSAAPGNALLKSLQRLGVDPLAIYGTNCLKFGTEDDEQATPWLTRELHIVQPKLVVVMGDGRRSRFLDALAFPLADPLADSEPGSFARFTPTIEAIVTPDIDAALDDAGREDGVLERLQGAWAVVGAAAAVLSRRRAAGLAAVLAALIAWDAGAGVLPERRPLARRPRRRVHRPPRHLRGAVARASRCAQSRGRRPARSGPRRSSPSLLDLAGFGSLFNVTKLLALTAIGFLFVQAFEALSWVVLIALIIPWVDALSVWRGPTSYVVSEKPSLFDRISIAFRLPGETARRTSARPTSSSSRSSSPPPTASA